MSQNLNVNKPATRDPLQSLPVRTNFRAIASTNYGPQAPADAELGWLWIDASDPTNIKLKAFINNIFVTILNNLAGGPPPQTAPQKFTHTQVAPSTTWTIVHNLNTENVTFGFIDALNQMIIPNVVQINTVNQVTATFLVAQTGRAIIVG